jgi:hypothetical protein
VAVSAEAATGRDEFDAEETDERTVAVWRPGMSHATYRRLLRLLFDPDTDGGGASSGLPSEQAA